MPSSPDTLRIHLYGMENSLKIYGTMRTWLCLIEIHATQAKFLQTPGYFTKINCIFTFHTKMFLVASSALWPSLNLKWISSCIRLHNTFICAVFKSHTEWSLSSQLGLENTPVASLQKGNIPHPEWVFWIWH